MQIIKPHSQSLIHRTFFEDRGYKFYISPILFFSLSKPEKIIPEQLGWQKVMAELTAGRVLDIGAPKHRAEVLLSGSAIPPNGLPVNSMEVGFGLFNHHDKSSLVNKSIMIYGEQHWQLKSNTWHLSEVKPLSTTPLVANNAYGGQGYADNPLGKGYCQNNSASQQTRIDLPNLRAKEDDFLKLSSMLSGKPRSVNFGALDLNSPVLQQRAGTYDEHWLKNDYPGLAIDHDPAIYNVAQEDQWLDNFPKGDELFTLNGVHPSYSKLNSQLPAMKSRAFIQKQGTTSDALSEVDLKIDTLWFFPNQDLGVVISRGRCDVNDSEAQDIESIMVAYERMADPARELDYYQHIHHLRTDPELSAAHALHESQLTPLKSAEQLNIEKKEVLDAKSKHEELIAACAEQVFKKMTGSHGLTALIKKDSLNSLTEQLENRSEMKKTIKEINDKFTQIPIITPQAIQRGDIDLSAVISTVKKITDQCKKDSELSLSELDQKIADVLSDKAREEQIKTQKNLKFIDIKQTIDERFEGLKATEYLDLAQLKEIESAKHLGRLTAPSDSTNAKQFDSQTRDYLRQKVIQFKKTNTSLSGLDLSGANLQGIDFSKQDMSGILLESANLSGCNFTASNLQNSVLTSARVDNACFDQCDFSMSNLSDIQGSGTSFKKCHFNETKFIKARLIKSDFSKSHFESLAILESTLDNSNFSDCYFDQTQWLKCEIPLSDWNNSVFKSNVFIQSRISESQFTNADVSRCIFAQVDLQHSSFKYSHLDCIQFAGECCLENSDFSGCTAKTIGLLGIDLASCLFIDSIFKESNFSNCHLSNTELERAGFLRCVFTEAKLTNVNARECNFLESLMNKAHWLNSDLSHSDFFNADTKQCIFENCELHEVVNFGTMAEVRV